MARTFIVCATTVTVNDEWAVMPRGSGSRAASPSGDSDSAVIGATTGERQSVSELVRNYSDPPSETQKRDRSESGDPAPAGKRGARERSGDLGRSPSSAGNRSFRESLDDAIDGLETRVMSSFSRELHEFRQTLTAEISKLHERVKDMEQHIEERDGVIDKLTEELGRSKQEVSALQQRVEEAEINSHLPCLILSGSSMVARHAPRLEPPLPGRPTPAAVGRSRPAAAADLDQGRPVTSSPADRRAGGARDGPAESSRGAGGGRGGASGRPAARDRGWEEREDINGLVVDTLNRCMPGLGLANSDIDRAHRLPGPNNRVIVRFVRPGQDSARDQVMARRLELRGKDLFINESLTKLRGQIFWSLLAAKREKRLYTVYTRGGYVFFKEKQHGTGTRVDSLQRLRQLGYTVLER